jgi:hypothetical protein
MRISLFFTGFLLANFAPKMIQNAEKKIVQKTASSTSNKGSIEQTLEKKSSRKSGTIEKIPTPKPTPKATPKTSSTELQQVTVDNINRSQNRQRSGSSLAPLLNLLHAKFENNSKRSPSGVITTADIQDENIHTTNALTGFITDQHNVVNTKPIAQAVAKLSADQRDQYLVAALNYLYHQDQLQQQQQQGQEQETDATENLDAPSKPPVPLNKSQTIVAQSSQDLAALFSQILSHVANDAQKSGDSATSRLVTTIVSGGLNFAQAIAIAIVGYYGQKQCGSGPSGPPA